MIYLKYLVLPIFGFMIAFIGTRLIDINIPYIDWLLVLFFAATPFLFEEFRKLNGLKEIVIVTLNILTMCASAFWIMRLLFNDSL